MYCTYAVEKLEIPKLKITSQPFFFTVYVYVVWSNDVAWWIWEVAVDVGKLSSLGHCLIPADGVITFGDRDLKRDSGGLAKIVVFFFKRKEAYVIQKKGGSEK